MREGLDGATRSEIGAAYSDYYHKVHSAGSPVITDGFAILYKAFRNVYRKGLPAQEIIAGALFTLKFVECGEGLLHVCVVFFLFNEGVASPERNLYHIVEALDIRKFNIFRLYLC